MKTSTENEPRCFSSAQALVSCEAATWCPFRTIPSAAEAALISCSCLFSLETLEVFCVRESTTFALVEQEECSVWRWAIIDEDGLIVTSGRKPTQAEAREAAEKSLRLLTN